MKCKIQREIQNPTKKKVRAWCIQGTCKECGTKMAVMVSQEVADTVK